MPVTSGTHRQEIEAALDRALETAKKSLPENLPSDLAGWIKEFSSHIAQQATSAFNNLVTCLASKAAEPSCDPRYHRPPTEAMPAPPEGQTYFTGRGISEQIIYPWLAKHGFRGSMSGWQTRVFERESPYTMEYRENIARVKKEFLSILDAVANDRTTANEVLAAFFRLELEEVARRQKLEESLAKLHMQGDTSIARILEALQTHFALPRSARLPVLAIQAIYLAMMPNVARYSGFVLAHLSEHSAADKHTGAIGDIEVKGENGVFEAVEVKHGIAIDDNIIRRACEKIRRSSASRYYILSTHPTIAVTEEGTNLLAQLRKEHGCQLILNGVLPTLKYYLRLLNSPSEFLEAYQALLRSDRRVTQEQKEKWKSIWEDESPAE